MTTPAEKRARARTLRDVASTIATKADALDDDLTTMLSQYPHHEKGVWWGPEATTFYDGVSDVKTDIRGLRHDVVGYAEDCRSEARRLDEAADRQEAEEAKAAGSAPG